MIYIGSVVSGLAGGVEVVVTHAAAAGKLDFFPPAKLESWIPFLGAWVTMMFGSIPQQDVFQRITSARDERTAVRGSVLGGSLYFFFCLRAHVFSLLRHPDRSGPDGWTDGAGFPLVLPTLIVQHTPIVAQIVFFGALLSAIMSCSSATLLAPSIAFSENIVKGFVPTIGDRGLLRVMRTVLVSFTAVVYCLHSTRRPAFFEWLKAPTK